MPKRGEKAAFIDAAVSYLGNDCLLWPFSSNWCGYGVIQFRGQANYRVHRIVCERSYGPPNDDRLVAAHSCRNPTCIAPAHLRWATQRENLADMVIHDTLPRGSRRPQTKLREGDIPAIRELSDAGMNNVQIAKRYGVKRESIRDIIQRKSWAWL